MYCCQLKSVNSVACLNLSCICAVILVSILAFGLPTLAQRSLLDNPNFRDRNRVRFDASSIECKNVTDIIFVGVFPCLRDSNFVAQKSISECDLLAEAAAHLAVERVNQDPDVLPNITLKLNPTYVSIDEVKHVRFCGFPGSCLLIRFSDSEVLLKMESIVYWALK